MKKITKNKLVKYLLLKDKNYEKDTEKLHVHLFYIFVRLCKTNLESIDLNSFKFIVTNEGFMDYDLKISFENKTLFFDYCDVEDIDEEFIPRIKKIENHFNMIPLNPLVCRMRDLEIWRNTDENEQIDNTKLLDEIKNLQKKTN